MSHQARKLTELLDERDQWKQNMSAFFIETRTAAGQNQTNFAASLDISQPYLNQIEHGHRTPSSKTLAKLRSYVEGGTTSADQDQG